MVRRLAQRELARQTAPLSKLRELILLLSSLNRLWSATSPKLPGPNTYLILYLRSTCIRRPLSMSLNLRSTVPPEHLLILHLNRQIGSLLI
jgi:hypothetical protein